MFDFLFDFIHGLDEGYDKGYLADWIGEWHYNFWIAIALHRYHRMNRNVPYSEKTKKRGDSLSQINNLFYLRVFLCCVWVGCRFFLQSALQVICTVLLLVMINVELRFLRRRFMVRHLLLALFAWLYHLHGSRITKQASENFEWIKKQAKEEFTSAQIVWWVQVVWLYMIMPMIIPFLWKVWKWFSRKKSHKKGNGLLGYAYGLFLILLNLCASNTPLVVFLCYETFRADQMNPLDIQITEFVFVFALLFLFFSIFIERQFKKRGLMNRTYFVMVCHEAACFFMVAFCYAIGSYFMPKKEDPPPVPTKNDLSNISSVIAHVIQQLSKNDEVLPKFIKCKNW
jgi:hypothetical protein